MKKKIFLIGFLSWITTHALFSQDVNFRTLENTRHLVAAHFGADYGSYYGLSYGYVFNTKHRPIVAGTEFIIPFGADVLDDWQWKTGVQLELLRSGDFSLVFKPSAVFRRYESSMARMYNIGSDFAINVGFVKQKWSVVGIASFDKAIVTNIHNKLLKEYYPEIRDGWYIPSGGNFKFGARLQYGFGTWNTFFTIGKHFGQDFKANPILPFFAEMSVQKRLN
ncbi:MAG TPA: hypothetical protein VFW11_16115 [Cyclobacteriaceae bacterium]|nr:hypothetical protein [Cyclobacteriaceae bacterium]